MEANHSREIVERTRRIETRVTKLAQALNVDVGGGTPVWDPAHSRVIIPSPNCSVGAIRQVIPADYKQDVDVFVHRDYIFTLFIDP